MTRTTAQLLERYKENYFEQEFFKENVAFAFSQQQLQEAMEKLGAKDKDELTSIFGIGDICLKKKAKEIAEWSIKQEQQRKQWLQSLMQDEQEEIIEYELYNHECTYTWDIDPVVDLFEDVFSWNQIMIVFHKLTRQ